MVGHVRPTVSPVRVGKGEVFYVATGFAGGLRPLRGRADGASGGLTVGTEPENTGVEDQPATPEEHQHDPVNLARIAWASTALVFLIAAVILLARRETGYAGVTFAVAISAAINLL
jgi:hypothetical protein